VTVMPKRIYLARRNPNLTREQFRMRWRQHGALAMSQRTWGESAVRYVHSDPIPMTGGLAGASDDYDGVGMILHQSIESRRRRLADPGERPPILKDEDETFAARVATFGVDTVERVLLNGPSAGIKTFRFLWRRADLDRPAFRRCWGDIHAPLVLGMPVVARHIERYVQSDPLEPEAGKTWGLDCDGVEEIWYASLDALVRAEAEPAMAAVIEADRARFVGRSILVIAVDTVLFDVLNPAAVDGTAYPLAR